MAGQGCSGAKSRLSSEGEAGDGEGVGFWGVGSGLATPGVQYSPPPGFAEQPHPPEVAACFCPNGTAQTSFNCILISPELLRRSTGPIRLGRRNSPFLQEALPPKLRGLAESLSQGAQPRAQSRPG